MKWLAVGVLAGFAVKVPLMPFHTWLPAAYAEAPSPVTMLLTGAMSKMGVYGLLRIAVPLFGHADCADADAAAGAGGGDGGDGRVGSGGAKGFEARLCLLVSESPGLLPAGDFRVGDSGSGRSDAGQPGCGAERRDSADVQSWHDGGGAVLVYRDDAGADAAGIAASTILAGCASLRRCSRADGHCAVLVAGAAGAERICGRVSDLPRRVSAGVGGGDGFGSRAAGDGGGDSDGDSEGIYGAGAGALGGVSRYASRRAAGAGSGDRIDVAALACCPN